MLIFGVLSAIAVQDICKIRHLKMDLGEGTIDPSIALGKILENHPTVLPSYWRLLPEYCSPGAFMFCGFTAHRRRAIKPN